MTFAALSLLTTKENGFVDERARRDELKEKILVQNNKSCYCIIDNDGLETLDLLVRRDAIRAAETGDAVKAQSLEELATALNIPSEILVKTIEERNAEIASDKPQSRRFPIQKAPILGCPCRYENPLHNGRPPDQRKSSMPQRRPTNPWTLRSRRNHRRHPWKKPNRWKRFSRCLHIWHDRGRKSCFRVLTKIAYSLTLTLSIT